MTLKSILQDLGSLLKFMRICAPLDQDDFFTRLVLRPLKNGELAGAEILRVHFSSQDFFTGHSSNIQAIMTQVCIHRTKEVKSTLELLQVLTYV
jgi:SWI/SNF-related matrix-associated actin-dependent regulator of chromatin subfamily A3